MLTINLDDIISEGNVRVEVGDVTSLAASIDKVGMISLPRVAPTDNGSGQYVLIAGHRRLAALRLLERKDAEFILDDVAQDAADVLAAQWAENTERKDLSAYEQIEVAWDLKLEGLKQGEVAAIMGLDKKVISSMHKTHKAFASDDLDATRATQLSAEALFNIAEQAAPEQIPDVVRLIVDGEHSNVWGAIRGAEREAETAEFYDELAGLQDEWNEMGVLVVMENPQLTGEVMKNGQPKQVKGVEILSQTGIELVDHISQSCHVVWINTANSYGVPNVVHFCNKVSRHMPDKNDKQESDFVATQMVKAKEFKEKDSVGRKQIIADKKLRRAQAAYWMTTPYTAAERELMANNHALQGRGWSHDQTKAALTMLELLDTRPTGAEYSWYETTFKAWLDDKFKDNSLNRDRWMVRFLTAYEFTQDFARQDATFMSQLQDIEIDTTDG
jgi:hypothetical protein